MKKITFVFNNTPINQRLSVSIIQIGILLIFALLIGTYDFDVAEDSLKYISGLVTMLFVIELFVLRIYTKSLLNRITLFNIIAFLFSAGRYVLYVFNIKLEGYDVFQRINTPTLVTAGCYIVFGYIFFIWGSLICFLKKPDKDQVIEEVFDEDNKVKHWGLLFSIVGSVPFFYYNIRNYLVVVRLGYSAFYNTDVRSGALVGFLSYYFIVGLFLLFYGCKAKSKNYILLILLFIVGIRFLCGDRGDAISLLLAIYLLYEMNHKKNKKNIIVLVMIAFVIFTSVSVIGDWRHAAYANKSFINVLTESLRNNNIFVTTLSNLGGTIFPLAKVIELVPSIHGYLYGGSYFASLLYIIPSPFRLGFIGDIMAHKEYSSPGTWLMNQLDMTYGPGFTPFAESYLNFGYFGTLIMFLVGALFTMLITMRFRKTNNNLNSVLSILSFYLFAMSMRGSINNVFIFFVRYILLPYICIVFVKNPFNKERKKSL